VFVNKEMAVVSMQQGIKQGKCFIIPLTAWLILIQSAVSYGLAWTQPKHNWLSILRSEYYQSTKSWDDDSNLSDAPIYEEYKINLYLEYGLTDNTTIGFNLFGLHIKDRQNKRTTDSGNNEFFARYLLWKNDYSALSTQALINIPGKAAKSSITNRSAKGDGELRINFGTSGQVYQFQNHGWFIDSSLGFRERLGGPSDEIRTDITVGWKMKPQQLAIFIDQSNIISLRNPRSEESADFDLYQVEPSLLYWLIDDKLGAEVGVNHAFYGRNTGKGTSTFLSIWLKGDLTSFDQSE